MPVDLEGTGVDQRGSGPDQNMGGVKGNRGSVLIPLSPGSSSNFKKIIKLFPNVSVQSFRFVLLCRISFFGKAEG